jgi:2-dehydropantoate 2-reductase
MRSLIIGGGAIGQFCAARLTQGGSDVVIMARPAQAEALNAKGIDLHVDGTPSNFHVRAAADASDSALHEPFELVIVAVKAYSTPAAAQTIASIPATRDASILTVQNGLGNEEILSDAFGTERIVAGALTVAVDRLDTTSIATSNKGGLSLAPVGATPHNWIIAAFNDSGMTVRAAPNWRELKWSKLLINILGNGVCAALDWTPEQVYADRAAFAIERQCLLEALNVMTGLKLATTNLVDFPTTLLAASAKTLPSDILRVVLANRVARGRGGKLPSLLMDLRARRPQTEVMALNGAVAGHAARSNIEAPANAKVAEVVSGISSGRLKWEDFRGHPQRLSVQGSPQRMTSQRGSSR